MKVREAVTLAVIGAASGTLIALDSEDAGGFIAAATVTALGYLIASLTVAFLAERNWPHLAGTYSALIQHRAESGATGLAIVRGIACGLLVLGLHAVLMRAGISTELTWPRLQDHLHEINSPVPGLTLLGWAVVLAASTAFLVGFFLCLARRWTAWAPLPLAFVGLMWVASMSGVQFESLPRDGFLVLLTFLTAAAFGWVLLAFDLLTLLLAAFTFHLWLRGYALTKMFETVGNWQFWLPFALWAGLFVWALFAAFRPLWNRAGRRLAEMFGW